MDNVYNGYEYCWCKAGAHYVRRQADHTHNFDHGWQDCLDIATVAQMVDDIWFDADDQIPVIATCGCND